MSLRIHVTAAPSGSSSPPTSSNGMAKSGFDRKNCRGPLSPSVTQSRNASIS